MDDEWMNNSCFFIGSSLYYPPWLAQLGAFHMGGKRKKGWLEKAIG
jgi:hypothetical protein